MDMALPWLRLLHILILVYWLGGDLGAFYASRFLTDAGRPVGERALALKILNNVDMAPRTALILAFPTGVTLAAARGWIAPGGAALALAWLVFVGWLGIAWTLHLRHGEGGQGLRRVDLAIRYAVLAALVIAGGAGLSGHVALPWFLAMKMLVLAITIACGLLIRLLLRPLFAPVRTMMTSGPTPETDAAIGRVLARTRPIVVLLWALILGAAWLGTATPT